MKKKLLFITTLVAVMLFAVACTNADDNSNGGGDSGASEFDPNIPGWQQTERTERVTLTWFVQADWWDTSWGDDFITRTISELLNIDVEFITGEEEALNLLFAGGDLPDIMTIFDSNSQAAQNAPTWALPLNELAETYDPYFFNVASEDTLAWFELEDGNTYAYANYSNTFYDYENDTIPSTTAFLVRRDVYEAIGEMPMGTPEEFLAALDAISEQFPDLITLGGMDNLNYTLQNYLGVPILDEAGNFNNRNLDEDYLTWLRTFSEAHNRGHISDDSFANDWSIWEENLRFGNYAAMLLTGLPGMSGNLQHFMTENPGSEYIAIDGPASTVGNAPTLLQAGISGWMLNHISQDANAEVAIQLFTFLMSDQGQLLTFFGEEGETFEFNDDGTVAVADYIQDMRENDNEEFRRQYRFGEFMFFGHDRWNALNENTWLEAVRQPMEWGRGRLVPQFILENSDPDSGTQEARSLEAITTEWDRIQIELIRSSTSADFDALIAEYEAFLEANNWDAIIEVRNENIERNRERLGL